MSVQVAAVGGSNLVKVDRKRYVKEGDTYNEASFNGPQKLVARLFTGDNKTFDWMEADFMNRFTITDDPDNREVRLYQKKSGAVICLKYNNNFSEFYQNTSYIRQVSRLLKYADKKGGDVTIDLRNNSLKLANMDFGFDDCNLSGSYWGTVPFTKNIIMQNITADIISLPANTKTANLNLKKGSSIFSASVAKISANVETDVKCSGMKYSISRYE